MNTKNRERGITMMKRLVKNERGLTLIELLAVIVILGIIVAIAIPAIGAIIDNSKKDAHIANAKQMASAARLAISTNQVSGASIELTMQELYDDGFLDKIPKSPGDLGDYNTTESKVVVAKDDDGKRTYTVTLEGTQGTYIDGVEVDALNRDAVDID
jgi:type IV pilus assembly protein PilA